MVIDQSTKGGFRFRNIEEDDIQKSAVSEFENPYTQSGTRQLERDSNEKTGSQEFQERA
jgi:hypothetical protein